MDARLIARASGRILPVTTRAPGAARDRHGGHDHADDHAKVRECNEQFGTLASLAEALNAER